MSGRNCAGIPKDKNPVLKQTQGILIVTIEPLHHWTLYPILIATVKISVKLLRETMNINFDTLNPILAGAIAPALSSVLLIINPRLARTLKGFIPGINKYTEIAKTILPMIDAKLAQHIDLVDGTADVLRKVAAGEVTVLGMTSRMRQVAGKIGENPRELKILLDEIDEEFKATEFNKLNKNGPVQTSEFVSVDAPGQ